MNPVVSYIKQTLQGYYPDSELVPMAKLLLTQVFGMSVVELYAGKDTTFSVNEQKRLDDILVRLQKLEPIQYIIVTAFSGSVSNIAFASLPTKTLFSSSK